MKAFLSTDSPASNDDYLFANELSQEAMQEARRILETTENPPDVVPLLIKDDPSCLCKRSNGREICAAHDCFADLRTALENFVAE